MQPLEIVWLVMSLVLHVLELQQTSVYLAELMQLSMLEQRLVHVPMLLWHLMPLDTVFRLAATKLAPLVMEMQSINVKPVNQVLIEETQ